MAKDNRPRNPRALRIIVVLIAVLALAGTAVPMFFTSPAQAATPAGAFTAAGAQTVAQSGAQTGLAPATNNDEVAQDFSAVVGFNRGMIISDEVFYNPGTMDAAGIQTFLNKMGAACVAGSGVDDAGNPVTVPCLKDYSQAVPAVAADSLCGEVAASENDSAATIIWKVAQACSINPQVLLVLLQKEQSLLTASDSYLVPRRYRSATGFACPDTAPCDAQYYGFFNQLYQAAHRFQYYRANPTKYRHRAGRVNDLLFHPRRDETTGEYVCGTIPVFIENQATAGLYNYTPYTPNDAALAAGGGLGDDCSSYGNRNFCRYFTSWFGSTGSVASVIAANRITGSTRVETATAITSRSFPATSERVYLARADRPVDALVGGSLTDGPVLLVPVGSAIPQTVMDTVNRLQAKEVIALGGTASIPDDVLAWVGQGRQTGRIFGTDRVSTAFAVAHHQFPAERAVDVVYVADALGSDGQGSPDAVVSGMLTDGPVLLVNTKDPASVQLVAEEIQKFGPQTVFALGGQKVISDETLRTLAGSATADRLAGPSRYDTSVAIARRAYPPQPLQADENGVLQLNPRQVAYVTRGESFVDALVAGSLTDGPVLLTPGCTKTLPSSVSTYLGEYHAQTIFALGGLQATCGHTVDAAVDATKAGMR